MQLGCKHFRAALDNVYNSLTEGGSYKRMDTGFWNCPQKYRIWKQRRLHKTVLRHLKRKSARRDSNPRPSPWQGDTPPLSHSRIITFIYLNLLTVSVLLTKCIIAQQKNNCKCFFYFFAVFLRHWRRFLFSHSSLRLKQARKHIFWSKKQRALIFKTLCLNKRAGDGNRTHVSSLEGWCSTIELHPHI